MQFGVVLCILLGLVALPVLVLWPFLDYNDLRVPSPGVTS